MVNATNVGSHIISSDFFEDDVRVLTRCLSGCTYLAYRVKGFALLTGNIFLPFWYLSRHPL